MDTVSSTQERAPLATQGVSADSRDSGACYRSLRLLFAANVARDRLTGTGSVFLSLADALSRRGHHVEMLLKDDLPIAEKTGRLSRIVFPYLVAREIGARVLAGKAYDAVLLHEPSGMAYALARKWNSFLPPLVAMSQGIEQRAWELNGERTPRSMKTRILHPVTELLQANYALRNADAVACVASEDADYASRRWGALPGRIHLVFNGVDAEFLKCEWVPSESPGLLFVGTWILRKGSREVVQLFSVLKERFASLRLTIVGSGVPTQDVLNDFPSRLWSSLCVLPRVSREDMPSLLARDQVFLLPSYFEGMPLSLLEAMAAGLPCVTTNVCGMRDLVQDHTNGLLITPGDVETLVRRVSELLESSALRSQIGARARETARRITWDKIALQWEAMFVDLAEREPKSSVSHEYDRWHAGVSARDDLEKDLGNPWHRFARTQAVGLNNQRVLEAACGRGQLTSWLKSIGALVVAVDFSTAALRFARERLDQDTHRTALSCADVQQLPFASDSFDCVVSCETLEHVKDQRACLREFRRVLRTGGRLILTTENYLNIWGLYRTYLGLRGRPFNSGDRVQPLEQWMFSPRTLRLIRQSGFRVVRTDGEGHHLLLLPGVNPPDLEVQALSRIRWTRRALRWFARHFFLVAEAV